MVFDFHHRPLQSPESQVKQRTLTFLNSCEARFADDPSLVAIVTLNRTLRDSNYTSSTSDSGNNWSRIISGITSGSSSSGRDEEDAGRGTFRGAPRKRKTTNSSTGTVEEGGRGGRREEGQVGKKDLILDWYSLSWVLAAELILGGMEYF